MSEEQFNEYLKEFEPVILVKSKKTSIQGMDYKDISQEIRLKIFLNIDKFDANKASFVTWANKVSNNVIKNLARDSKTKKASYLNTALNIDDLD
jgi:DNA-directed RNA polymerase specialized sigma24 family protein